LKIAICDDDIICREMILELVQIYITEQNQNLSVTAYEHGDDLLEDAKKIGGYDIYLLDVLMPETDGIQLGLSLRKANLNGKIIYLTSSEDHAIDAFRAKASNYILKPVTKEHLFPVLTEVIHRLSSGTQKSILVKTKDGSVKLAFDDILYANLHGRTIDYHLISGQTIESNTIRSPFTEAVQELLADSRFMACGASAIVNLHHISTITSEELFFKTGASIYVSKRAAKEILSVWSE